MKESWEEKGVTMLLGGLKEGRTRTRLFPPEIRTTLREKANFKLYKGIVHSQQGLSFGKINEAF